MKKDPQIFLSHSNADAFEASLLQVCLENLLRDYNVNVWSYQRDQAGDEKNIGGSLKERVRDSVAVIMLVSQCTLESGATQWMELAYADAFDIPTFVLLHHITFEDVKGMSGVPPLFLQRQCTSAIDWLSLEEEFRQCCSTNH